MCVWSEVVQRVLNGNWALIFALWAALFLLSVLFSLLLRSLCCQEPGASHCRGLRGLQGRPEPSGALAAPATGLAYRQGEGRMWQGSSRGLRRAGNGEPVRLGLCDVCLPLRAQGCQNGGSSCSWFPAGAY